MDKISAQELRWFECHIDGCETRTIHAKSASSARYLYWLELSDILVPYSKCFMAIKSKAKKSYAKVKSENELLVDNINNRYKIGDTLKVRMDSGEIVNWTMKHEATILGGHTAVIWANEHKSCYLASRVVF